MPMHGFGRADGQAFDIIGKHQFDGIGFHHIAHIGGGAVSIQVANVAGIQMRIT